MLRGSEEGGLSEHSAARKSLRRALGKQASESSEFHQMHVCEQSSEVSTHGHEERVKYIQRDQLTAL